MRVAFLARSEKKVRGHRCSGEIEGGTIVRLARKQSALIRCAEQNEPPVVFHSLRSHSSGHTERLLLCFALVGLLSRATRKAANLLLNKKGRACRRRHAILTCH